MSKQSTTLLSRRTALAGAGTAGALAAAAAVLPLGKPAADVAVATRTATEAESTGGYQLTEHVKRYYRTARV
jgi:hypothetical protein